MNEWAQVTSVLLGSWPSQVATWGREAIASYIAELQARGVSPDAAIVAIRSSSSAFPPSAGGLAELARRDPHGPSWPEAERLIFGCGGVLAARTPVQKGWWALGERAALDDEAARERAAGLHPLIGAFVQSQGLRRLRRLDLEDAEFGEVRRRALAHEWEAFCECTDRREIAAVLRRRVGGGLRSLDPAAALPAGLEPAATSGGSSSEVNSIERSNR